MSEGTQGVLVSVVVTEATSSRPCMLGIAAFDSSSQIFYFAEFFEPATDRYPHLESVLLSLQPRSLVVSSASGKEVTSSMLDMLKGLVEDSVQRVTIAEDFGVQAVEADVNRLRMQSKMAPSLSAGPGIRALATLFTNGRILADRSLYGSCDFQHLSVNGVFMRLDRACYTALNIMPPSVGENRKNTSLFGLLNKCRTAGGTRTLQVWLRQPLVSESEITARHEIVESLLSNEAKRQRIQTSHLSKIPDLEKIKIGLKKGGVGLEHLVRVYESVIAAGGCCEILESIDDQAMNLRMVKPLRAKISAFEGYMRLVETCIDLELASKNRFVIARSFDEKLNELAGKQSTLESQMERVRSALSKKTGVDNIRVVDAIGSFGYCFRVVKKSQDDIMRDKTVKQVQMNKAEFLFTTSALQEVVEELKEVEEEYAKVSASVVTKAISVASTYGNLIGELNELLSSLDVLCSFALAAASWKLVRPIHSKRMQLVSARHILIEARQIETGGFIANNGSFIPNDVVITNKDNIQIITGLNMGGKSTYIRTAAMCALLSQVGSFVPCERAELPIFSAIHCRVGACDEQLKGVSTFMQEMLEAACILNSADKDSLVIIDELGRGTSSSEGFGLAWAIAKDLKDRVKCFTLFATHYLELATLPGAKNRHATAAVKDGDITFLYKVIDGVAETSYGPHVAKIAGYPNDIVNDAQERLAKRVRAAY